MIYISCTVLPAMLVAREQFYTTQKQRGFERRFSRKSPLHTLLGQGPAKSSVKQISKHGISSNRKIVVSYVPRLSSVGSLHRIVFPCVSRVGWNSRSGFSMSCSLVHSINAETRCGLFAVQFKVLEQGRDIFVFVGVMLQCLRVGAGLMGFRC